MKEADVLKMLLARRDNYGVTRIEPYRGRVYRVTMQDQDYRAVVLVSSFEYYEKRYHIAQELPELIICLEHNTVTPLKVLSMRAGRLAQPYELPELITDMESARWSKTGARVLIGAYISGMRLAQDIVNRLPYSTRTRYLNRVEALGKRKRGLPVALKQQQEATA